MGKRRNGGGSISRRKDGRRMAQYVAQQPEEGGSKRKTVYGKTRAEVARKLAKAVADRERGLVFDDKGLTVGEAPGSRGRSLTWPPLARSATRSPSTGFPR